MKVKISKLPKLDATTIKNYISTVFGGRKVNDVITLPQGYQIVHNGDQDSFEKEIIEKIGLIEGTNYFN